MLENFQIQIISGMPLENPDDIPLFQCFVLVSTEYHHYVVIVNQQG